MARSKWKLNFLCKKSTRFFIKRKMRGIFYKIPKKKVIKIYSRSTKITQKFYRFIILIHNGAVFRPLRMRKLLIGRCAGEFSFTRKPFHFPQKKKKRR